MVGKLKKIDNNVFKLITQSSLKKVISGVPQGSMITPKPFFILIISAY